MMTTLIFDYQVLWAKNSFNVEQNILIDVRNTCLSSPQVVFCTFLSLALGYAAINPE